MASPPEGGPSSPLFPTLTPFQQQARASYTAWTTFFDKALEKRLDMDKFADWAPIMKERHGAVVGPVLLADVVLRPTRWNTWTLDPRVPYYLQTLLDLGMVDVPAVLAALWRYSTAHGFLSLGVAGSGAKENGGDAKEHENEAFTMAGIKREDGADESKNEGSDDKTTKEGGARKKLVRWQSSFTSEEVIFYRLTKAVAQGAAIKTGKDAVDICAVMARWMALFTTASATFAAHDEDVLMGGTGAGTSENSPSRQKRDEMDNARAAFVMLLLGVCENAIVLQALSKDFAKKTRKALSQSLASFIPSIAQTSSPIASRLELFRSEILAGFDPADKKKEATDEEELGELLDGSIGLEDIALQPLETARSRAGLYIYLNAALVGRPLLDDASIYGYLHNRFEGDIQTTAIDLILASFDVLANAIFRNEGQKSAHLLRSYLINKVPLILASFAASASPMYPFDSKLCIENALSRVDTTTFPTLSSLFENGENGLSSNPFTESVRSDFVTACCLHGLVPESSIDKLIGDYAYQTLPAGGRYVKDKLVQECLADDKRILSLITELDKMEGNAGAVCQALTEMVGRLCTNKDTISLKPICSQLARNPLNLDVLLLFDKTTTILHPLCDLLDNMGYENDGGEYQPVYEDFGSILLLLLAFVYRYNLSASDLGIRSSDSFVAKLLSKGQLSRPLDELSEQENGQLNGWINGLFDTEGAGLSDELLSNCPPQDFYLLIPTLFHNVVLASSTGYLTEKDLKTFVEYFVDTFLLPSLVMAIMYLSNCLWTDRPEENKAIIKILQLILKPNQELSQESSEMLNSVRNIVAKPLENGLRTYQRQNPTSQDVQPLLQVLRENIDLSRRTGAAGDKELEQWTSGNSGGLLANIKHTMNHLTMWSMQQSVIPTSYAHRQILVGLKHLGAKRVLHAIIEELKQQTEAGSGSVAYGYDVAVSLVCAPDVNNTISDSSSSSSAVPNDPSSLGLDDAAAAATTRVPPQRRLSLRDALKFEAAAWKKFEKKDPVTAEILVRLYQKTEKQMAPVAVALAIPMVPTLAGGAGVGVLDATTVAMADALGVDDATAAAAAAGMMVADPMALDPSGVGAGLGVGVPSLDLGGGPGDPLNLGGDGTSGSAGGLDLSADDWGLGPLDGWDGSMDLS